MSVISFPISALVTNTGPLGLVDPKSLVDPSLAAEIPGHWKLSSDTEQGTDKFAYSTTDLEHLHSGRHAKVFKGYASYESPTEGVKGTGPLVFKVASGRTELTKLRHEAGIYSKQLLKSQVDRDVPKFFGLYTGRTATASVGVMILEHCGEALSAFKGCDVNTRMNIVHAVTRLHMDGHIRHRDLYPPNVLVRPDGNHTKVTIIDFGLAIPHGLCPCKGWEVFLFSGLSVGPWLPCDELQSICEEIGVLPCFPYYGESFEAEDVNSAQDLVDRYAPNGVAPEEALQEAESVWKEFNDWRNEWKKLDPDLLPTSDFMESNDTLLGSSLE